MKPIVKIVSISALVLLTACSTSRRLPKQNELLQNAMTDFVAYLSDDRLEGRRTGTVGEKLAMEYIAGQFSKAGLAPKGTDGYFQSFSVNEGKKMRSDCKLILGNKTLVPQKDFFVFPFSAAATISTTVTPGLREMGAPWLVDLHEVMEENKNNPHFDLPGYLYEFSSKAKEKGATALLWYNSGTSDDKLIFNAKDKSPLVNIPVFYIKNSAMAGLVGSDVASLSLHAIAALEDRIRTGSNVVGYIDNGASTTVVLGAHFDHLGYGEDGNSRYEKKDAAIHNGADDNASGTAVLMALGFVLKKSAARSNNYLLIAFSGEELGLYGSKHFVDNPTIDLKSINYMINMDMVGRLNDSTKIVTIGGYGTSPLWSSVINNTTKESFSVKIDSSGSGPSDHTSFYRKDIPVLFYFTGLHSDYHKPSDDADRINYRGMGSIMRHIVQVVEQTDKSGRLAFLKTRETQTTTSARFSVSMGIMPDYTYSGNGVRADGVSEGRAAQKAGIRAGDIVLQIGEYKVSSMESYMQTLGKFKKGDQVKVIYQRGSEQLVADIQF
ncbi:MAG: M28 family peptidase [Sphingomonadales bacterium]